MQGRPKRLQGGGGARVQVREGPGRGWPGLGTRLPSKGRDLALIGLVLHYRCQSHCNCFLIGSPASPAVSCARGSLLVTTAWTPSHS